MRLQKTELLLIVEKLKVMKEEKAGDKKIMKRQQEIINALEKRIQGEDIK